MKKRILSLLLVLLMVVSLVPTAALAYKSDTDVSMPSQVAISILINQQGR